MQLLLVTSNFYVKANNIAKTASISIRLAFHHFPMELS